MNLHNKEREKGNQEDFVKESKLQDLIKRFKKSSQLLNVGDDNKVDKCDNSFDKDNLIESIRLARLEWLDASRNFEFAYDKEVIDYYTYQIKASETRYQYLLKLARERSIKLSKKDNAKCIFQGKNIPG